MRAVTILKSVALVSIIAAGALTSSAALAVMMGPVEDPVRIVKIPPGQPIVIGVYEVLSGPDTGLGLDQLRGIEIAVDDMGGQLVGHPIRLIVEDEQCTPEGGQTAATKIAANQQVVLALGGSCSSASTPAAPILWQAGIPDIGTSPSNPFLTAPDRSSDYDGFLRTIYNDLWAGAKVAEWVRDVLKFKKVATIHDGSAYAENLVRVFQKNYKEGGGEVCSDEAISPTDTDMRPVLTKIATCKPELVYYPIFVSASAHISRQKKEIDGLQDTMFVGSDAALSADVIEAAGDAIIGFRITSTALEVAAQGEGYAEFLEKYEAKYGEGPLQGFHGNAYDAAMIGFKGIQKVAVKDDAGNTYVPIQALVDALFATKNHRGLTGTLTCDQYGDCAAYEFTVYQYVNSDPSTFGIGVNPVRVYPKLEN